MLECCSNRIMGFHNTHPSLNHRNDAPQHSILSTMSTAALLGRAFPLLARVCVGLHLNCGRISLKIHYFGFTTSASVYDSAVLPNEYFEFASSQPLWLVNSSSFRWKKRTFCSVQNLSKYSLPKSWIWAFNGYSFMAERTQDLVPGSTKWPWQMKLNSGNTNRNSSTLLMA